MPLWSIVCSYNEGGRYDRYAKEPGECLPSFNLFVFIQMFY